MIFKIFNKNYRKSFINLKFLKLYYFKLYFTLNVLKSTRSILNIISIKKYVYSASKEEPNFGITGFQPFLKPNKKRAFTEQHCRSMNFAKDEFVK